MNESSKKFLNFFLSLSITPFSIYIPALAAEIFIQSKSEGYSDAPSQAREIERSRRKLEDKPQLLAARRKGLSPFFVPEIFKRKISDFSIYPISTIPNTETYYCNEGYGLVTYKSDRLGFRNPDYVWDRLSINSNNLFVLGDSFTMGACVHEGDSIPDQIRANSNFNVINLASGGNGAYEYIANFKLLINEFAKKSNQSFDVLIVFFANDNVENYKNLSSRLLENSPPIIEISDDYDISINNLYSKSFLSYSSTYKYPKWNNYDWDQDPPQFSLVRDIKSVIKLSKVRFLAKQLWAGFTLDKFFDQSASAQFLKYASNSCKRYQCRLHVTFIEPSPFWRPDYLAKTYKQRIIDTSKAMNINYIDSSIDPNLLSDFAPKGPHLSIEGNKKLAISAIDGIQRQNSTFDTNKSPSKED